MPAKKAARRKPSEPVSEPEVPESEPEVSSGTAKGTTKSGTVVHGPAEALKKVTG